jgi:hypothetical protein
MYRKQRSGTLAISAGKGKETHWVDRHREIKAAAVPQVA